MWQDLAMAANIFPLYATQDLDKKRINRHMKFKKKQDLERKTMSGTLSAKHVRTPTWVVEKWTCEQKIKAGIYATDRY
jgi:hypothetical protein